MPEIKMGVEMPKAERAGFSVEQKKEIRAELDKLQELRDRWSLSQIKQDHEKQYTTSWVSPIFSQIDYILLLLGSKKANEIKIPGTDKKISRVQAGLLAAWRKGESIDDKEKKVEYWETRGRKIQDFVDRVIEAVEKDIGK